MHHGSTELNSTNLLKEAFKAYEAISLMFWVLSIINLSPTGIALKT